MKKIILLLLLFALGTATFSQQTETKQHWTETDYYKKSKKQKTWGWVSTGVGGSVLLVTFLTDAFSTALTLGQGKATGTTLPYIIGAAGVTTGVVLLVASGKNKKKSMESSVFIQMEKASVLQVNSCKDQLFPAVGLKIKIK